MTTTCAPVSGYPSPRRPQGCCSQARGTNASLLLFAAVLLCGLPVSARLPVAKTCPLHIDCAKERRHLCKPGSSHCGPCLSPFEENEKRHCVLKNSDHQQGEVSSYPDPEKEIDYIHAVIEKQQVSNTKPANNQSTPSENKLNQGHPSSEALPVTTSALQPAVSVLGNTQPGATGAAGRAGPVVAPSPMNDKIIVILVSLCVVMGIVALILATLCFVKLHKESRLAQKVDYPALGKANGPHAAATGTSMGDKTLAQSAQMYHYQHQKQQMLAMGNHRLEQKGLESEVTSDEEEVGGDFTVYECPGLAPTGEMEVKNPLFDDSTVHYQSNHK